MDVKLAKRLVEAALLALGGYAGWVVSSVFGGTLGDAARIVLVILGVVMAYGDRLDALIAMLGLLYAFAAAATPASNELQFANGMLTLQASTLPATIQQAPIIIVALLLLRSLHRRLSVASDAAIRVARRECSLYCKLSLPLYYTILALGATGFAVLASSIGSAIASALDAAARASILAPLARLLLELRAFTIILVVFVVYVVYRFTVTVLEPTVYAVLAPPHAAKQLVDEMVESEANRLAKGEAWHQKLLYASLSTLLGVIAIPLAEAAALAGTELLGSLGVETPLLHQARSTILSWSPLASLAIFLLVRRAASRRVAAFVTRIQPPRPRLSIIAGLAAAAMILYYAGPQKLVAILACPILRRYCAEAIDTGLLRQLSMLVDSILARYESDVRYIASLIDAIVVQLFGG